MPSRRTPPVQEQTANRPATSRPAARRGRPSQADRLALADRRDQILAAATRRFAESGFIGTTVRQIADDVQILSGSLYHHFATKEDMLGEAVHDTVIRMRDMAQGIANRAASAQDRLSALIRGSLAELHSNMAVHAILYNERKIFRQRDDFAYILKAKKETFLAWERIFADGVADGRFRADIDIFLTATTTMRMLNLSTDWFRGEGSSAQTAPFLYDIEKIGDFYCSFILRSVCASPMAA